MSLGIKKSILLSIAALLLVFTLGKYLTWAQESPTPTPTPQENNNSEALKKLQDKINELQGKVSDLQNQEKTLSSQIAVMDNQIKLTEYRIEANKEQILNLEADIDTTNKKIGKLEKSLDELTKILLNRIVATYETGTVQPFYVLLSSSDASNFFTKLNYLKIAQSHDQRVIYETEQAKVDYANQKEIFEEKKKKIETLKKELEAYTKELDQEKQSRQELLDITKNDERRYQQMLAQARAEYEAILGIKAGRGNEVEAGNVSEGDRIASVISGASACSSGTHLHFQVTSGGSYTNPAGYLSSKDVDWDLCGWYGCDGPFGFSGSWRWPIEGRPRITQGYGMTAYASRTGAYGGGPHTGIDMLSDDLSVKAVKEGTLFRGSISCGGGSLRYVKVEQKDGLATYYLHVNP